MSHEAAPRLPDLSPRFDRALREAVAYLVERFDPVGIIAAGTIVRGTPHAASDFDIVAIVNGPGRQRIQRRFEGVAAELFVNSPGWVLRALEQETRACRPILAHMLATGFVVLDRDPVVAELRDRAREALAVEPHMDPLQLTWSRYATATMIEDAFDLVDSDPESAAFLATTAVGEMLRFVFFPARGRNVPRWKELFSEVAREAPEIGAVVRRFYDETDPAARVRIAGELSDAIVGARGFFEWESDVELLDG